MVEMANWNIEKDIKDFLYFEEFGNNKSPNTIKSMKKDLFQLAEYLNVSQKSYSRYERGERTIDPEILSKLATFHETTVDYLIERTDDKTDYTKKKRR